MYNNIGNFYIRNGQIVPSEKFVSEVKSRTVVYEVVRVINQKAMFLSDHLLRLKRSLEAIGEDSRIVDEMTEQISTLIDGHSLNKNIKIDVFDNNYRCYFIESFYPDELLYQEGIKTTLFKIERDNPTVKKLNMNYKRTIEEVKNDQFFEVLLEDEQGNIIEGSRSNLLFIKNRTIISAPLSQILHGVTFKNVIKMAANSNIDVIYKAVSKDELSSIDACFITGTSIGVLPIKSIDEYSYSVDHPILLDLISAYSGFINDL